ncbi:MAG TPA: hypothetical protein VG755_28360, partial [Nannocystaceae bacterium]|nr:hypothetical protein [Nannocystaceae bacterium]
PLVETVAQGLKSKLDPPRNAGAQAIAVLERAPRWLELPAFPTCGGERRSLAQLMAWVVAEQRIPYVEAHELGAPPETLLLSTEVADRLSAVLGADALQNVTPALRLQAQRVQFEQRPQRDGLALPRGEILVSVEVDTDGLTGTLAIPLRMPHEGPGAVTICHRLREVCVVDPIEGTPLVGVLDGDGLGAASGFVALADAEVARIRTCANLYRDDLLRALRRQRVELAAYGGLVDAWARHLLVQLVPRSRASHVALSAAGVAELADMPLFIDSKQQPLTLGMLRAEMDDRGEIGFVTVPGLTLDRMLVLARDNVEVAQLRAIFERLTDCDERARKRAEVQRGLAEAPPLPQPGDDAFIVIDIDERGLVGRLWLDRGIDDDTGIWMGLDGRAIEQRRISKTFPCAGAITGPGVELDPENGKCVITRQARAMLRTRSAKLYRDLLAELREAMPPADDPRTRALARLLLRLHASSGASTADAEQRRAYRELRELPLLPLPNGRAIALDVALRERPAELAYLGLWQPQEAAVDDGGAAPVEAITSDDDSAPIQLPVAPLPPQIVAASAPEPASALLPPAPPSREQILVQLVRDELRMIRERDQSLFAEPYLERIRVSKRDGELVAVEEDGNAILDVAHPIVRRALAQPDPLIVSLLASAAFTVLNVAHEALTDEQEARVLAHHAAYLRTAPRERAP